MKNDILIAIDNRKAVAPVLLDLSAAFDTVENGIMLRRLEKLLGLRGKHLAWLRPCFIARSQCVPVEDALFEIMIFAIG